MNLKHDHQEYKMQIECDCPRNCPGNYSGSYHGG